nr:hypothetical protein Itr_chr14CG13220 [Ipomoea trifida]
MSLVISVISSKIKENGTYNLYLNKSVSNYYFITMFIKYTKISSRSQQASNLTVGASMPADGHFAASHRLHASSPSRILTLPRRLVLSPPPRLAPRLLALSCQEDEHLAVLDSEMLPKGMVM